MEFYLGTILSFPYGFIPRGWLACDGQLVPISTYNTLFALIGTIYGGNGSSTFALPDLNGGAGAHTPRVAAGQGHGAGLSPRAVGQEIGADTVTLSVAQMPAHSHNFELYTAADNATAQPAAGDTLFTPLSNGFVSPPIPEATTFDANAVIPAGGSQPHQNDQPTLQFKYGICVDGIFPSFN